MTDLVKRLRDYRPDEGNHWKAPPICDEAATRIEALEAARAEAEMRGYEAAKEQAAQIAQSRDLSIMSSTVVDMQCREIAAAIRAMVKQ